jgi:hypothetical protein
MIYNKPAVRKPNLQLRMTRIVNWVLNRIPRMSYFKYLKMQEEIDRQDQYIREIHDEYMKIMENIPAPRYTMDFGVKDRDSYMDKIAYTEIRFEPMRINNVIPRESQRSELALNESVMYILHQHAEALSRAHADAMRDKIMDQTLTKLNIRKD